jgi:hypothetical protein
MQSRYGLPLLSEARAEMGIRLQIGVDDFDSNVAAQLRIVSLPYFPCAATSQWIL